MVTELRDPGKCLHCGRTLGVTYGTVGEFRVCHPDASDRPDCYHLITVYHHIPHDCARCTRTPWVPLTRNEQHDAMLDALSRLEAMIQDVSP